MKKAIGQWMYNNLCVTKETNEKLNIALEYLLVFLIGVFACLDWQAAVDVMSR